MFENLTKTPCAVSFLAERTRIAAPGIAGGDDGAKGEIQINGDTVDPKSQHILKSGDTVMMRTPGGGGYGKA